MAEQQDDTGIDLAAFIPETYKGEGDVYDTAKFRADFDAFSAFKAGEDDRRATLPKEAGEYAFALPEGHVWPEGFDPEAMKTKDEQGNEVAFDPSKIINAEDPDIPLVQGILHKLGAPASVMSEIASIMVNREMRGIMEAKAEADNQMKALGPNAKQRIDQLARTVGAKLPQAQARAVLDGVGSADALRGLEELLKSSTAAVAAAPGKGDLSQLSPRDRLIAGLQQRDKRA